VEVIYSGGSAMRGSF